MALVIIPPPYRGPTLGEAEIEVEASTVKGALEAVGSRYPGFSEQIFDASGRFHRFVKVFLNEDLVDPGKADAEIGESDRIEVVAAIAGG